MNGTSDDPLTARMAAAAGDPQECSKLLQSVYADLLRLARAELARHVRGATLNTRALVHEAYLKLFSGGLAAYVSRRHFFATAAKAMRQVVIDYSRERMAQRRGAGAEHVPLDVTDAQSLAVDTQTDQLLALDNALGRLAERDPRLAEVVELRFFAGLGVDALAELLEVSVPTIVRDTRAARAWLRLAMEGDPTVS